MSKAKVCACARRRCTKTPLKVRRFCVHLVGPAPRGSGSRRRNSREARASKSELDTMPCAQLLLPRLHYKWQTNAHVLSTLGSRGIIKTSVVNGLPLYIEANAVALA